MMTHQQSSFGEKRSNCCACGKPLSSPRGTRYCSRQCRMFWVSWVEFYKLRFILLNSRWAGGAESGRGSPGYLRQRMWDAVRRLSSSADLLGEVIVEIVEIIAEEAE